MGAVGSNSERLNKASAGVREVRFHDLRHTFGTHVAALGVPIRTLQEWMGHPDFKTTLIYTDYAPSKRDREWVELGFQEARACPDLAALESGSRRAPAPRSGPCDERPVVDPRLAPCRTRSSQIASAVNIVVTIAASTRTKR